MRASLSLLAALIAVAPASAGCDGIDGSPPPEPPAGADGGGPATAGRRPPAPPLERATCPPEAANCAAVTGRVLYVEAVDPDGDGDAHYVLVGGGVTAPGITVVDVGPHLRPRRLPRPGERVSAAGPVFTGSFGQRQIEATEVHHER